MIYLDYNATTPVAEEVLAAMLPWFSEDFGNPSSSHAAGRWAADAVESARQEVAALLNVAGRELVFTSGATESNNLALRGVWTARRDLRRRRVLVTAAEHNAVLEVADALPGAIVEVIPVDSTGMIDLASLERSLDDDVALVSVIAANNEVGTLNPVGSVVELGHKAGAIVHTDATQWVGKLPIDVRRMNVDLLSLSSHKLYGPKGVGALFIRRGLSLESITRGGGQERGIRSGTLNVPGIVGLGSAARLASQTMAESVHAMRHLRDRLQQGLEAAISPTSLNGHPIERLPNTLNVRIHGAEAEAVLTSAPGIAASTGSACTSAVPSPSHVLIAMGLDPGAADECIRFSLGAGTTSTEVDSAVELIAEAVRRIRHLSSWQVDASPKEHVS